MDPPWASGLWDSGYYETEECEAMEGTGMTGEKSEIDTLKAQVAQCDLYLQENYEEIRSLRDKLASANERVKQLEAESGTTGNAMAWVVFQPQGSEFDYKVFWYESDARDDAHNINQEAEEGVPDVEPIPLFASDANKQLTEIITACRDAGFVDKNGKVRKVLGTLVLTADGCVVGEKAIVYWHEDPYEASCETLNTNLAFFEDHAMDATGEPCGNWERIEVCYSTEEAARQAAERIK